MQSIRRKQILVVEEVDDMRELIGVVARKAGGDTCLVSTITEAQRMLETTLLDLIICNLAAGTAACEGLVLAAHKINPSLPLVIFTSPHRLRLSAPLRDDNCHVIDQLDLRRLAKVIELLLFESHRT